MGLVCGRRAGRCAAPPTAVRVVHCSPFPATRGFMMLVALVMLVALWLLLTRTRIGLVIQAALTHPEMVEALGHNVPRVFMLVFGGGCCAGGAGRRDRRHHLRHRAVDGGHRRLDHLRRRRGRRHGLAGRRLRRARCSSALLQTLPLTVDKSLVDLLAGLGLSRRARRPGRHR